jgi:hypothetical protein
LLLPILFSAQKISGVQLFNPQTNDETPVIKFGEQLILNFDDLNNSSTVYKYTIKHLIEIGKMMVCFLQNLPKEI